MSTSLSRKAKYKKFADSVLKRREDCTASCEIYGVCPFSNYDSRKGKQECVVKNLDKIDKNRFIAIFVFGDEGLKNEALKMLYKLGGILNLEDDPKEMQSYLEMIVKIIKAFKIDYTKVETDDQVIEIKLDDVKVVGDIPVETPVFSENFTTNDPESLMDSDKLDEIITPPANKDTKIRVFS